MSERRFTSQYQPPLPARRSEPQPSILRKSSRGSRSCCETFEGGGDLPLPAVVAALAADEHEASFSEGESRQEASERARNRFDIESFLLIARTRHVVTIVNARSDVTMSSAGCSGIPAFSRLLQLPGR